MVTGALNEVLSDLCADPFAAGGEAEASAFHLPSAVRFESIRRTFGGKVEAPGTDRRQFPSPPG